MINMKFFIILLRKTLKFLYIKNHEYTIILQIQFTIDNNLTYEIKINESLFYTNYESEICKLYYMKNNAEIIVEINLFAWKLFLSELQSLSEMMYIGPFRNAINIGTNENYFDISVGQSFI